MAVVPPPPAAPRVRAGGNPKEQRRKGRTLPGDCPNARTAPGPSRSLHVLFLPLSLLLWPHETLFASFPSASALHSPFPPPNPCLSAPSHQPSCPFSYSLSISDPPICKYPNTCSSAKPTLNPPLPPGLFLREPPFPRSALAEQPSVLENNPGGLRGSEAPTAPLTSHTFTRESFPWVPAPRHNSLSSWSWAEGQGNPRNLPETSNNLSPKGSALPSHPRHPRRRSLTPTQIPAETNPDPRSPQSPARPRALPFPASPEARDSVRQPKTGGKTEGTGGQGLSPALRVLPTCPRINSLPASSTQQSSSELDTAEHR